MSATIEKIRKIRVAVAGNDVVLMMDGQEDTRIVIDVPVAIATQLTTDLIAAGFGPAARGGRA